MNPPVEGRRREVCAVTNPRTGREACPTWDQKSSIIQTFDDVVHCRKARCFPSGDGIPHVFKPSVPCSKSTCDSPAAVTCIRYDALAGVRLVTYHPFPPAAQLGFVPEIFRFNCRTGSCSAGFLPASNGRERRISPPSERRRPLHVWCVIVLKPALPNFVRNQPKSIH